MSNILISGHNIKKSFPQGSSKIDVLKGVDIEIYSGEALCILGSSGAGKVIQNIRVHEMCRDWPGMGTSSIHVEYSS